MGVDLRSWFWRWRNKNKNIEAQELRVILDKTTFARFERLRTRVLKVDEAKLIDLALKCLEKKVAIIIEHRSSHSEQSQSDDRLKHQKTLANLTDTDLIPETKAH